MAGGLARWLFRGILTAVLVAGGGWWIYAKGNGGGPPQTAMAAWLTVLFFGLLIGSAFSSSSEIALFSLDKLDLSQLRNSRKWTDRAILRLLDRPNGHPDHHPDPQ